MFALTGQSVHYLPVGYNPTPSLSLTGVKDMRGLVFAHRPFLFGPPFTPLLTFLHRISSATARK